MKKESILKILVIGAMSLYGEYSYMLIKLFTYFAYSSSSLLTARILDILQISNFRIFTTFLTRHSEKGATLITSAFIAAVFGLQLESIVEYVASVLKDTITIAQ